MRKLPGNAGLDCVGDTYCCVSKQVETTQSIYFEAAGGCMYIDIIGSGKGDSATICLSKSDAERVVKGISDLLPNLGVASKREGKDVGA